MYTLKVEDFIEDIINKSSFDVNDMIHICKRKNNTKREYLFVNKYQGKHVPTDPLLIRKLYMEFSNEVLSHLSRNEKILVVAFAETATALGMHISTELYKNGFNIVAHLQTSREKFDKQFELISFEEEHSHATTQKLYYSGELPTYDRILFVEDEITTGNTILNFIEEFKKINPLAKYSVASVLNWQNSKNQELYREYNIDTYYLISGKIKSDILSIKISENEVLDFKGFYEETIFMDEDSNCRLGVSPANLNFKLNKKARKVLNEIQPNESVDVIGTEEFMYYPLIFAQMVALKAKNTTYHATTRSPITCSDEAGYVLNDGYHISSAYENERDTFIYNKQDVDKTIIVTEKCMSKAFKESMKKLYNNPIFIKL